MDTIIDKNGRHVSSLYDSQGNGLDVGDAYSLPNLLPICEFTQIFQSAQTGQTQGSCIDDNGNIFTIYHSSGKISRYNIYSKEESIITFTPNAYGHANDATYNPNTGYIYVAPMLDTGEVYILDPQNDMALVDTVYAYKPNGSSLIVWNIAYNREIRKFVILHAGFIYLYNDDFTLYDASEEYDTTKWTDTGQGMETDGKYIYALSYNPNICHVFKYDGTFLMDIDFQLLSGEPETIIYDWNTKCFYVEQMKNGANIHFARIKRYYTDAEMRAFQLVSV